MLLIFLVLLRPPISRRSPLFVIICSTVFAILSVSVLIILIGLILVSYWSHIGLIGGTGLGLSELLALGDGAEPSKPVMASAPTMGHSMAPTVAGPAHCHAPHAVPSQKPCVCRAYAMRCRLPRGPAFSSSRNQGTAALSNPDERPSGDSKVISKYLQIKLHITLQGSCVVLKIEVAPKVVRKQRSESCIPVLRFEICRNKMNTLRQQQLQQSASQQCAHPHTHKIGQASHLRLDNAVY